MIVNTKFQIFMFCRTLRVSQFENYASLLSCERSAKDPAKPGTRATLSKTSSEIFRQTETGLPEEKAAKVFLATRSAPTCGYPERIPFSNARVAPGAARLWELNGRTN